LWDDRFWEELDDATLTRMIIRFIIGLAIFKTLVIALVVAYIAATHGAP
jgi:hypothetical protein